MQVKAKKFDYIVKYCFYCQDITSALLSLRAVITVHIGPCYWERKFPYEAFHKTYSPQTPVRLAESRVFPF